MSQIKVEDHTDQQPEKPQPMNIEEEFPWYTVIMMVLYLIAAIVALVECIIATIKNGFF